jgi:hypothetical protein
MNTVLKPLSVPVVADCLSTRIVLMGAFRLRASHPLTPCRCTFYTCLLVFYNSPDTA